MCVSEEIETLYDPETMEGVRTIDAADANQNRSAQWFKCPSCGNTLKYTMTRESTVCCFSCSHCCWSSLEIDLQATTAQKLQEAAMVAEKESTDHLEKMQQKAVDFYAEKQKAEEEQKQQHAPRHMGAHDYLLPNYRWGNYGATNSYSSPTVGAVGRRRRRNKSRNHQHSTDKLEKRRADLLAKRCDPTLAIPLASEDSSAHSPSHDELSVHARASLEHRLRAPAPSTSSGSFASLSLARKELRIKRSIRCRSTGKLLLKPDMNPQHGDSTKKTNVGSWFRIQNLARSFLPRVRLWRVKARRSPNATDGSEGGSDGVILLHIRNPALQRHSPVDGAIKVSMSLRETKGTLTVGLPSEPITIEADDRFGVSSPKAGTPKKQQEQDVQLGVVRRGHSYVVLQVRVRAAYGHHEVWNVPLTVLVAYKVPEYIHQPGALSFSYNVDIIADVRKYLQPKTP